MRLGTIRVNYPRMTAETGPCGLWPDDIGPTYRRDLPIEQAALESRLRHAAQSRRAGRRSGRPRAAARRRRRSSPSRRATVLDKYRKGEATATQYPDANKGKISDVGQ